jgi:hypothetical protein
MIPHSGFIDWRLIINKAEIGTRPKTRAQAF